MTRLLRIQGRPLYGQRVSSARLPRAEHQLATAVSITLAAAFADNRPASARRPHSSTCGQRCCRESVKQTSKRFLDFRVSCVEPSGCSSSRGQSQRRSDSSQRPQCRAHKRAVAAGGLSSASCSACHANVRHGVGLNELNCSSPSGCTRCDDANHSDSSR